ncbi:hypothetical protein Goshw_009101, partial [Gossypium schwendimanii]|nr:hypothetical protein [Gossypium schwendimanii]
MVAIPTHGWFKVNVDGLVLATRPKVAIGGVMRGSNGGWMGGFDMMIGMSNIFQVESWAMLEGLKLAWAQ